VPGIYGLAWPEINYRTFAECGRLDLNQGNAIGYLNFKGKVEHIFVIVPNLEDFRIDRVHLFTLSRHSPAAHDFPAADVSSVASIAKS
jgi:hypothetical protein